MTDSNPRRGSTSGVGLRNFGGAMVPVRGSGSQFYALSYKVLELVHEKLELMVSETSARCALLIDRTGCIMASAGDFHPINPSTMGATAAATIAALNTMVSRAHSPEVSVKFYGSDIERIHFFLVEERLILCLLHGRNVSQANIRSVAKAFATEIGKAVEADRRTGAKKEGRELLQSVNYIENKLDELFKDSTQERR
jgi:hypothetical protein